MDTQILISEKSNYGKTNYYPINRIAKTICSTYQKKTFTALQLKNLSVVFKIGLQVRGHTFDLTLSDIAKLT